MPARNVLNTPLVTCCEDPLTGFYRDGCCNTGAEDIGLHLVCAEMTAEFLAFSKQRGNDLSTPQFGFPGLEPGDRWCLACGGGKRRSWRVSHLRSCWKPRTFRRSNSSRSKSCKRTPSSSQAGYRWRVDAGKILFARLRKC
jgi:uncharacterized protein (DUF2237 family)